MSVLGPMSMEDYHEEYGAADDLHDVDTWYESDAEEDGEEEAGFTPAEPFIVPTPVHNYDDEEVPF